MVKRMISIALAVVMALSLTIVPASAADTASDASTNLVYYDLQNQELSGTNGYCSNTSGKFEGTGNYEKNAGGFVARDSWVRAKIKSEGNKILELSTTEVAGNYKLNYFGLKTASLADGDYSAELRKVTLGFKTSVDDTSMFDTPVKLWYNLYASSVEGLLALNAANGNNVLTNEMHEKLGVLDNDDLILFMWNEKSTIRSTWTVSGNPLYPVCTLGTVGQADYTADIEFIYEPKSDGTLNVVGLSVGGTPITTLIDETTPIAGLSFKETGNTEFYAYNLRKGFTNSNSKDTALMIVASTKNVNSVAKLTKLTYNKLKYEGIKLVDKINVGSDENAVAVYGDEFIKIEFGEKLAAPESIAWENLITIADESDTPVIWTGAYDENENAYKISIDQSTRLEHSTQYSVKLQGNLSFEGYGAFNINNVKNFITTYKKLNVKSALSSLPNGGEFSLPLEVENVSLEGGTFTIAAALYEKNAASVNMIASTSVTKTVALGESDDTISVGPFNIPSVDGAEYFAKVFFTENTLEGDKPIAQPIVLGTVKAPEGEIPAGSPTDSLNENDFALEFTKVYDTGRIKFEGTYSKTVKRPVFVVVKDRQSTPNVVYMDQLTVADDGKLGMDFNLIPELPIYSNGTYIVDVALNPAVGSAVTQELSMDFSNIKPVVSNLKFADVIPYCDGRSLPAEYDYFHFGGADSASTVNWYEYDEAYGYDTANSVLIQAGSPSLALTADLNGKEIYFTVLARTSGNPALEADAPVIYENKIKLTLGPVASNVGIMQEGNTLKPTYLYTHGLGYEEQGTAYTWYRADSADGEYTKVGTEANYSVTMSDKDKYFKVEVLPKARLDAEENEEETEINVERVGECAWSTQPYQAKYVLAVENSGSDDSSPSSSPGGGGGSRAPKENKVEITPVDTTGTLDLTDIKGHWAESDIYNLYDKGIVKGRTEHTFDPEGNITRAEFVALIVRALNLGEATSTSFSDVSASDWYAGVLGAAFEKGIFSGSEGNAYPNRQITRQEMAAIAVRALELNGESVALNGDILDFDDAATIDLWAIEAVAKAKTAGLIKGDGSNYRPLDNTSRAEAAVIICRLLAMR